MQLTKHSIDVIHTIALENRIQVPRVGRILFIDTVWVPLRWPTLLQKYGKEPHQHVDLKVPLTRAQLTAMHARLGLLASSYSVIIELTEAFCHGVLSIDIDPKNIREIINNANTNVSTKEYAG